MGLEILFPVIGAAIIFAWFGVRTIRAGKWKLGAGAVFIACVLAGFSVFYLILAFTPINKV